MHRMSTVRVGIALAALTASLGFAAVALADTELHGSTTEGSPVTLTVGDAGNATAIEIGSSEVECKHGTLTTGDLSFGPFDISDPLSFHDKSKDNSKQGKIKFKSKTKLEGSSQDGTTWSGTMNRTTKVFKHKDKLDTCRLNTSWTAS